MTRLAPLLLLACACATARPGPELSPLDAALAEGQKAIRDGRTDDAIAAARRALAADPASRDAMRLFVEAHFRSQRTDAVMSDLQARAAARPGDDVVEYGLGLAFFARRGDAGGEAVKHFSRAAELKPEVAEYHFRLGVVHLESERFPEAAAELRKARDLSPSLPRHHVPLALALSRTGDRKGAIEELRSLLTLSPDAQDLEIARKVMARLTDPFREFPKAVEGDFQRALDYLEKTDSPQQALVVLEEIVQRFPDLAVVHAALGLCHARLDDAGRAMDSFRRALELAPEDPRNHLYVADIYFTKERFDRALESYQAVVQRDPLNDHAYDRMAQIALKRGDSAEAVRLLRLVSLLRPDDATARQSLGLALINEGSLDEAEKVLSELAGRDPKNAEVMLRLGMLGLSRAGKEKDLAAQKAHYDRAAAWLEKVLDLQPQNPMAAKLLQSIPALTMAKANLTEVAELLTLLVNQAEKSTQVLERIEQRMAAVDAPTEESVDHLRQMIGRLDRLEALMKDVVSEMRMVSLFATHMTKRFEKELDELRAKVK